MNCGEKETLSNKYRPLANKPHLRGLMIIDEIKENSGKTKIKRLKRRLIENFKKSLKKISEIDLKMNNFGAFRLSILKI